MNEQNDADLVIVRTFDAPRELVWRAWTDPELYMQWWGPKYFTSPAAKIDLRVGGTYLSCMRGPAGPGQPVKDYWGTGTYKEIIPLEKIVVTDDFADEQGNVVPPSYYDMPGEWGPVREVTIILEEKDGKTTMTLRHTGLIGQMRELTREGWSSSFDKLAEALAKQHI